jgi:hypothetical protein
MKNLFYLLSIFILTSCGYTPNSDFTFTDNVSVVRIDSLNYNVTISGQTFISKNLNPNINDYAVSGTEMSSISDLDTCVEVMCTQVLVNRVYYDTYFFIFTTNDGKSSISLMKDYDKTFEVND